MPKDSQGKWTLGLTVEVVTRVPGPPASGQRPGLDEGYRRAQDLDRRQDYAVLDSLPA